MSDALPLLRKPNVLPLTSHLETSLFQQFDYDYNWRLTTRDLLNCPYISELLGCPLTPAELSKLEGTHPIE